MSEPHNRGADRLPAIIRDDVQAMAGYHVPDATGFVKLDAMENPHQLPSAERAELAGVLAQLAINRYPVPSYSDLKQKIAQRLAVPAGCDLILGNGSDELISLLAIATARPGAVVLSAWPSFVMYDLSARFAGSRFVGVPLRADFSLDTLAMLAAIAEHQPAVVFIAYPNNPTGNCFDQAAIEAVIRAAPGLVVIDEAYQPFAPHSWLPRLPEFEHLLVLRTVSKLGLAGIRLGYMAGAPRWIAELEKVRPPYNINVLTEAVALFMLDRLPVLDEQAARLRAERGKLLAALRGLPGIEVFDSAANFILFRVGRAAPRNGPAVWQALRDRRVLIKDVGRMHPLLADCLRVTVSTAEENAVFVEALRASLS